VPSWDIFLGFSDKKKYIKGRMSIATIYPEEAAVFVTNPETHGGIKGGLPPTLEN